MNGLSVMPCVQAGTLSGYSVYGPGGKLHGEKMIRISRQETMKQESRIQESRKQESTRQWRKTDKTGSIGRIERQKESNPTAGRTGAACSVTSEGSHSARHFSSPEQVSKAKKTREMKNPAPSTRVGRKCKKNAPAPLVLRVLILALFFAGMIAGFQTMTGASSRAKEQTYKYYTTVTVGYGEDITDIVYQYCDSSEYSTPDAYIREICEINGLSYHKGTVPELSAGTQIVIPYFDTELK